MKTMSPTLLSIALIFGTAVFVSNQPATAQSPPAVPSDELPPGSEVLTRGPVHEAFAKPVTTDPQAPLVVTQQPPDALQEMPPAEKPAGANIVWVPGYWAWDEDRGDFIWVSGCWRNAPPNTYWVPGHWLQLDNGWEWISGFWEPITDQPQQGIEYLPAPPPSFEVAPAGTPPTPDQIWVPGCWYWVDGRYVQRHGYWIAPQVGWVWVPTHFAWTPRGYIFCQGHWDYDLDNRGVLFSPAFLPRDVRIRAGFVFCPGICVDLGMLQVNLFVNPRYNHYCFGDYYDAAYQSAGIYPWYKCQTIHSWYDPLFVYDKWHFGKTDSGWAKRQAQEFKARQRDPDLRPAHTYTELRAQFDRLPAAKRPERPLAESVKVYAASQSTPVRFERIDTAERQQFAVKSTEVRDFRNQRSQWEAPARQPAVAPATHPEPRTEKKVESAPQTVRPGPSAETKPAPEPVSKHTTFVAAAKPAPKEIKPVKSAPAPQVRVTQPEREVVTNPLVTPKPAESRYIAKTAPSAPASENLRASAPARSSGKNPPNQGESNNPPGKDRQK